MPSEALPHALTLANRLMTATRFARCSPVQGEPWAGTAHPVDEGDLIVSINCSDMVFVNPDSPHSLRSSMEMHFRMDTGPNRATRESLTTHDT